MADNADEKSERPDNDANPFVDVIPTSPPPLPPPSPSKKKPTQADTSKTTTKAEGEGDSKVGAVPAPAAVEPRLLPESPEDRDAYLQREIRNKLKQLKESKLCENSNETIEEQEKVSDLLVQVETLELKIYYVGYITNEAIEEMRDNEASKNSEEPENEGNPVSEVTKKHTEDLTSKSKQAMEGKPQLETLVDEKGEGATGSQDTHKQPMEEGDPKVEAVAKPAVVPDPLPAEPEESIVNIKRMLMKEIEVLGQKYERVLQLLENDQGPPEMMKELLEHAINEAKRLRCRDLISYLEKIAKRRSTLAHK
ncbi:integrator complex subunit 6-A-like [Dipodomys merriami]|uniref:integrator complex subunit 6-A-like n=1 Tax=Dipodomys merriami TaxID=94247 RepID=UPI003855E919